MKQPIYAIGDIHGQLGFLDHALRLVDADGGPDAEIVFLGDLVDRGPDSRAVIQRLMDGQAAGRNWHVLKGNHDRMFARFIRGGIVHDPRILSKLSWLHSRLGGDTTLASYGVKIDQDTPLSHSFRLVRDAVPSAHIEWLENLPLTLTRDGLLFVHAGIVAGVPLEEQLEDDLIWIREPFLSDPAPHPWLVVHGHTSLQYPTHFGNRIDLDGGAGYGRPIVPAVFEGTECWLLTDQGRKKLEPDS
jgi:serine/threonine protein phosphatase 1